jgi:hypothetical protein
METGATVSDRYSRHQLQFEAGDYRENRLMYGCMGRRASRTMESGVTPYSLSRSDLGRWLAHRQCLIHQYPLVSNHLFILGREHDEKSFIRFESSSRSIVAPICWSKVRHSLPHRHLSDAITDRLSSIFPSQSYCDLQLCCSRSTSKHMPVLATNRL